MHDAELWALTIVQGPFSVAPCQTKCYESLVLTAVCNPPPLCSFLDQSMMYSAAVHTEEVRPWARCCPWPH
jgi:hypothetical protein